MNNKLLFHILSAKSHIISFAFVVLVLLVIGCTPKPSRAVYSDYLPPMFPDYINVWIPQNIAPLNFLLRGHFDAVELKATCGEITLTKNTNGNKVCIDIDDWKSLLSKCVGKEIKVTITGLKGGIWTQYKSFAWHVVSDAVDPFLTYRLIEPDYEIYQNLSLRERCVENFEERSISDFGLVGNRCMNCHTFAGCNPNLSMMYIRGEGGGAILNRKGHLSKLDIKGSVYFCFSPNGKYLVYSSNVIIPAFHAMPRKRLEVFDRVSDIFVADLDRNTILRNPLLSDSLAFETFPVFSPDGKYIYFCLAPAMELPMQLKDMRYSLCRIEFDEKTGCIGDDIETLLSGEEANVSVCHPRISPDGKYIVYTVADYGTFPIWHQETDLQMMNVETGEICDMRNVNSDKSDTYHSWSSNSRWLVFASKRDDGLYGKPYYCYIDSKGNPHKPFVLPQKDPSFYDNILKSFNVPEIGTGNVPFTATDVANALEKDAVVFN